MDNNDFSRWSEDFKDCAKRYGIANATYKKRVLKGFETSDEEEYDKSQ